MNSTPRSLLVLVSLIALAGCSGDDDEKTSPVAATSDERPAPITASWTRPEPPTDGFVGSIACRECHADLYESYQSHPMSRSLGRPADMETIEDYDEATEFQPSGHRSYRVEREGDTVVHHEVLHDEDGEVLYDSFAEVEYVLGSGQGGRSYLIRRGDRLMASCIGWYTQGSRWDLSPGYQPLDHYGFERQISDNCVQCHSGRSVETEDPHLFASPAFIEESIGCERCHGPGLAHVEWHSSAEPAGEDPVVNPSRLEVRQRESVCNQCHLSGVDRVPRYGRSDYDFRPGDDLADVWTLFVARGSGSEHEQPAVSQVEQMHLSQCYIKSEGAMGCISCHDPHGSPSPDEQAGFYRQRCLTCHEQNDPPCSLPVDRRLEFSTDDSCIECHMPNNSVADVPHTTQSDHRIPRIAGARGADRPSIYSGESDAYELYDDAEARLPAADVERGWGIFLSQRADALKQRPLAEKSLEHLLPLLDGAADDDLPLFEAAAFALIQTNRPSEAQAVLDRAFASDPDSLRLHELAVALHEQSGEIELALEHAVRLTELNPDLSLSWGLLAYMQAANGQQSESIASARRGIELKPGSVPLRSMLLGLLETAGDDEALAEQREILRQLQSSRAPP